MWAMNISAHHTTNEAALRLARAHLPNAALISLLTVFADATNVLNAQASDWRALGLSDEQISALSQCRDHSLSKHDQQWLNGANHQVLCIQQAEYPDLLREVSSPPAMLFLSGNAELLWKAQLAVVGSRHCSDSGIRHTHFFTEQCARKGWAITSGMAAGIDAAAHQAALSIKTSTIAVLACGVDVCYPQRNQHLFDQIAEQGLLVSEHPPNTPPLREQFPSRNRIIAGLGLGTLVVEANLRSGALITARLAAELGREVFAIPGSIHNPHVRGCHRLIKQGASLIESPEELLEQLQSVLNRRQQQLNDQLELTLPNSSSGSAKISRSDLPRDRSQRSLLKLFSDGPMALEQLIQRSGLTYEQLCPMLLTMELSGLLVQRHGRYQRV
jgi:DNA processing protein